MAITPSGFIPTYVGHTQGPNDGQGHPAVHPHIRGAYDQSKTERVRLYGSSPHTWGIRKVCPLLVGYGPVHPHIRGAYFLWLPRTEPPDGSSPHTWGIRLPDLRRGPADRFIPTYVGHTRTASPSMGALTVHPHIRGAYGVRCICYSLPNGSSPHTWGIPRQPRQRRPLKTVHPHIRGAYKSWLARNANNYGSSPHTWGIQRPRPLHQKFPRFIPTYVGHTLIRSIKRSSSTVHPHIRGAYGPDSPRRASVRAVHPHIRGAYRFGRSFNAKPFGSSPHTWGIPVRGPGRLVSLRFIPTYVGHTDNIVHERPTLSVHPHIRGAYGAVGILEFQDKRFIPTYVGHTDYGVQISHSVFGSSPHTWGIHFFLAI